MPLFSKDGISSFGIAKSLLGQLKRCQLCQRAQCPSGICATCKKILPYRPKACSHCGKIQLDRVLCDCHEINRAYDSVRSIFFYEPPISNWIQQLKYQRDWSKCHLLAHLIQEYIASQAQWIIPVPLHPKRLRKRGYNQVEMFLAPLKKQIHAGFRPEWVSRKHDNPSQTQLCRQSRLLNLKNAFEVDAKVKGQHILLVDDVFTTGATVQSLSRACRDKGAASIQVLTIAQGAV